MVTRKALISPIHCLLSALTTEASSSTLLSTFTTHPPPVCHEHGLPQLAPFLGRSFTGQDGVSRYFALLAEHLDIKNMTFEPDDAWVVDEGSMTVYLRGSATFTWKGTGQSWDETFVYRVAVAEDVGSGSMKVCEYRVWADTGAAYLARVGRLEELGIGKTNGGNEQDGHVGNGETRSALNRKRSGCQDVLGGGLNVYGSCG